MHQKTRPFTTATIGIVLLILMAAFLAPSLLRIALALSLIFFLPGYGLTAVLFPRQALDIPARLLFSVGLSLATTAISGLILHLTRAGIGLQNPLLLLLIGLPAILGLYSLVKDVLRLDTSNVLAPPIINSRPVLLFILAAVITVTAVIVARRPAPSNDLLGYSIFWVQAGQTAGTLQVGVRSEEFTTTSYQVRVETKNGMRDGPVFALSPGETWTYALPLSGQDLTGQPVTLLLYRLDHPNQVYRRVVWWYENN